MPVYKRDAGSPWLRVSYKDLVRGSVNVTMNDETRSLSYPLLGTPSLLRMLSHAIGDPGCMMKVTTDSLVNFLSFDVKYNKPSIIRAEIARAFNMDLLETEDGIVKFTTKALEEIDKLGFGDGLNDKLRKAMNMEKKGMNTLAMKLRMDLGREGTLWTPDEWKNKDGKETREPAREPSRGKTTSVIPTRRIEPPKRLK